MGAKKRGETWRRQCGSKARFGTETGAARKAAWLRRIGEGDLHAYRCPFCRFWHIGHH